MDINKHLFRFGSLGIYVSTLVCFVVFISVAGGGLTFAVNQGSITGEDVKLEIAAPRITGFGQFFVASSVATSTAEPGITGMSNKGLDPIELFNAIYGSGRPGAEGDIVIEGIGLGGATGIIFEGAGVSGVVEPGPNDELNPMVFVHVRIEPWAESGPRRFTLLTPRGEVSSGDVVFSVQEPRVIGISDAEGAPGTGGFVTLFGVGLDQTQEIRFEGEGVTAQDFLARGALNPSLFLRLDISPTAPLGHRRFSVVTSHGVIESGDIMFSVSNPRIDGISDGNNFNLTPLARNGEGAPGTSGSIQIQGVGLRDASAIDFSERGVTGSVRFPTVGELLNPHITADVTITPDAPIGPQTFTLAIPRGSGVVSSAETNVTLTVTPLRIDVLSETEAAPGARGLLQISGVGIGNAMDIQFEGADGLVGQVRPIGEGVLRSLNSGVTVNLTISPTATFAPRHFTLTVPNGMVQSGELTFTVSPPRMTLIDTRGNTFGVGDPPSAVVPGASGLMRIYGVGLFNVVGVRISGEGVTATLEPTPRQGPALNPFILVSLNVSPTAPLGDRMIELELASDNLTLTGSSP